MIEKRLFINSAVIVTLATLLSKLLGLVRQQYGLYFFGGGFEYDAFVAAFRIPNALRELLAEGALSAAFIPLFAALLAKNKQKEAFVFANKIILIALIMSIVSLLIAFFASPFFMQYYHNNPDVANSQVLAKDLFNILMIYLPFISVAAIFMGMLHSLNVFFVPSLGPFISNVFFLIVLFSVYSLYGIHSLAYALIIGGIAHLIIQIPFLIKQGFKFKLYSLKRDSDINSFIKLFIPYALALGIPKLNNILSNIYADAITGANTALSQGFFMIQLPISLFVVSISTISLPSMARYYQQNDIKEFINIILVGFRMVFIFTLPSMIAFMLLDDKLSAFVYKDLVMLISNGSRGLIDDNVIKNISYTIFYFAPCIVSIGFSVILIRAFQSIRNMFSLIYISLITVFIHVLLMHLFIDVLKMPFYYIALSISITSFLHVILLFIILKTKIKSLKLEKNTLLNMLKTILASLFMGFIILLIKDLNLNILDTSYKNELASTLLIMLVASISYFIILYSLKEEGFIFFVKHFYTKLTKKQ